VVRVYLTLMCLLSPWALAVLLQFFNSFRKLVNLMERFGRLLVGLRSPLLLMYISKGTMSTDYIRLPSLQFSQSPCLRPCRHFACPSCCNISYYSGGSPLETTRSEKVSTYQTLLFDTNGPLNLADDEETTPWVIALTWPLLTLTGPEAATDRVGASSLLPVVFSFYLWGVMQYHVHQMQN
jgi:hypothetical protein